MHIGVACCLPRLHGNEHDPPEGFCGRMRRRPVAGYYKVKGMVPTHPGREVYVYVYGCIYERSGDLVYFAQGM